jgi:hypothetical protein
MTTVSELMPGDIVQDEGLAAVGGPTRACFVAQTTHPVWRSLQLVIWRLEGGRWSHDALDARQEIGWVVRRGGPDMVRAALGEPGDWWNR